MGSGNDTLATELWGQVEAMAENLTDNVNFYNALEHNEHIEPASNGAAASFINKLVSGTLLDARPGCACPVQVQIKQCQESTIEDNHQGDKEGMDHVECQARNHACGWLGIHQL